MKQNEEFEVTCYNTVSCCLFVSHKTKTFWWWNVSFKCFEIASNLKVDFAKSKKGIM